MSGERKIQRNYNKDCLIKTNEKKTTTKNQFNFVNDHLHFVDQKDR